MTNQNIENLLNLALDATNEEREKSQNLDVGYSAEDGQWEVIVKYSGSLDGVRGFATHITELRNGYAIIRLRQENVRRLSDVLQIEYIEKPKRLYFQTENGRRASCINLVQDTRLLLPSETLFGEGVLVAILDSGIDYVNRDFRNADGSTRIYAIWDQTITGAGSPPKGYSRGTLFTREKINEALEAGTDRERFRIVPSRDSSGHGTAVAGIAVGNGQESGTLARGVASRSELLIVKLGVPGETGFPRTTELMEALNFAVDVAVARNMPLVVNISIGNTYGAHDGTSLLERFVDEIAGVGRTTICIGTGNEGTGAGHVSGGLENGETDRIEFAVQQRQNAFSIQIWKRYEDEVNVFIRLPSGEVIGPIDERLGTQRLQAGSTEILLYYGEPSPYSVLQEIYLDFLPHNTFVTEGIWEIWLSAEKIVVGAYEMWMPSERALNRGTGFLFPTENLTFTIPSTAERVITVGAYDALTGTYAPFSGRGELLPRGAVKPDLVAPGVGIVTTGLNGGTTRVSGTSFATPFVTGSAALLMEWGIVKGNDAFLYGEKVKAYLRRGAQTLPGFAEYPNPLTGYGALCVERSLPE